MKDIRSKLIHGFALILILIVNPSFAEKVKQEGFEYTIAAPAEWVKPVSLDSEPSNRDKKAVSWLLSDSQVSLKKDRLARFSRYAAKVNQESGLRDASEFTMYFQPDFQTLELNFVKRHRKGKIENITKNVDVRLLQREEGYQNGIYDGGVSAILLVKDVQVGDIVEYAYTVNGRNPIFDDIYFASFPLNWGVFVDQLNIRLETDKKLFHKIYGDAESKLDVQNQSGVYVYSWTEKDVTPIYEEGEYPVWYDPYSYIQFSQFNRWSKVVEWAEELYQLPEIKDKELLSLRSKWAKESKNKKEYAEKVIRYAQNNIHYFGIEIGQNSHRPYPPDLVFERKFGDCKDKVIFINTLLAMEGIKAYPALVSTRMTQSVEKRLPQPGVFDHVITVLEIDGQEYWIDGTRSFQFGKLENIGVGDFRSALVIRSGQKKLTQISESPKLDSVKLDEVIVANDYAGPATLTATFTYAFAQAESTRAYLSRDGIEVFSKDYKNYFSRQYPKIELLGNVQVEDDELNNKLKIVAKFSIPDFWENGNDKQYQVALYGDSIHNYVVNPSVIDREMPLALSYPVRVEHSVELNYNDEINWDLDTSDVVIESDSIRYLRELDVESSRIKVSYLYETRKDNVPAEKMDAHINEIKDIRNDIYYSIYIDKSAASSDSKELKSTLKMLLKKNRD